MHGLTVCRNTASDESVWKLRSSDCTEAMVAVMRNGSRQNSHAGTAEITVSCSGGTMSNHYRSNVVLVKNFSRNGSL